jgi:hypothetical protein
MCAAIGMDLAENATFQPVHWCAGSCLAVVVILFVSQVLPSNGSICHIASSLKLFVPNILQAYHHIFSEGCACDISDRSHLPSLWLGSHGDHSPTAPAAPSLRPLILSCSLIRCEPVKVYHLHLPLVGAGKSSESGHCS